MNEFNTALPPPRPCKCGKEPEGSDEMLICNYLPCNRAYHLKCESLTKEQKSRIRVFYCLECEEDSCLRTEWKMKDKRKIQKEYWLVDKILNVKDGENRWVKIRWAGEDSQDKR